MEVDPTFSTEVLSFLRDSINKIYEGRMVYCSTAKSGIEIWHESKCKYAEREDPLYCARFMDSSVHKKQMNKSAPSFERQWLQKNWSMAIFKFNSVHFVFRTDSKQYNFEIPEELQEELVSKAKRMGTFAEFKPIISVVTNPPLLKSV